MGQERASDLNILSIEKALLKILGVYQLNDKNVFSWTKNMTNCTFILFLLIL